MKSRQNLTQQLSFSENDADDDHNRGTWIFTVFFLINFLFLYESLMMMESSFFACISYLKTYSIKLYLDTLHGMLESDKVCVKLHLYGSRII